MKLKKEKNVHKIAVNDKIKCMYNNGLNTQKYRTIFKNLWNKVYHTHKRKSKECGVINVIRCNEGEYSSVYFTGCWKSPIPGALYLLSPILQAVMKHT